MDLSKFIKKFSGFSEEIKMYGGEVTLRYNSKDHAYHLVLPDGNLKLLDGVTNTCHIIDKSEALVPWGCKMMEQKLLETADFYSVLARPIAGNDEEHTIGLIFTKQQMEEWVRKAKSAHKDALEDAGSVGKDAHNWIERYIKAVLAGNELLKLELLAKLPSEQRAANCCMAAIEWMACHNVRWISTERKIYSRLYQYAGTMDGLCLADSCDNPKCCPKSFTDRLTLVDWKTSNYLYIEYCLQTSAYQHAHEEETGEHIEDRWIIRLGKDDAEFDPWYFDNSYFWAHFSGFLNALSLKRSVAEVESGIGAINQRRTEERKKAERDKKEAELKIACKGSKEYKGIRKPVCNGGNPCESCLKKYAEVQEAKRGE